MSDNKSNNTTETSLMSRIVSLCKRRGFIYPASEIYGGLNGFWDFGPLGTQLKNNLRDAWWKSMVECPPIGPDGKPLSIVGIDTSIIQHPKTWEASGHVGGFSDPMQTCRVCKKLFRADHIEDMLREAPWVIDLAETLVVSAYDLNVTVCTDKVINWLQRKGKKLAPGLAALKEQKPEFNKSITFLELLNALAYKTTPHSTLHTPHSLLPCPNCGGDLTEPRQFNLMFESRVGPVEDDSGKVYLRPETAQGIFLQYKNVLDTSRVKPPFGVAQVGKSFRNEVTPRNFVFRTREFEQMEMEFFVPPEDGMKWYEFWVQERLRWWEEQGVAKNKLYRHEIADEDRAFYSAATADIEYLYPFTDPNFGELEGVAYRTDYDLTQHQKFSGVNLEYIDQETKNRYIPHVIEPASGLTRGVLVLLCEGYRYDEQRASPEWLKIKPSLAPIKAGIFPLVNKDGMPEVAEKLYMDLRKSMICQFDAKQSIGKRYARMDEAGTPFCVTIDGDTLKDSTVTIRNRDTAQQERVSIDTVKEYLNVKCKM
ncbi:MAG: glycine--tRNA ligase [Alphaproteobacteria bacterium]|nr:glycine--tRNA ligase [Alphaproteobacteria bacterium]MCL2505243.1 glycine--tRNA ligase [Alphaproteobacteria bacterium]